MVTLELLDNLTVVWGWQQEFLVAINKYINMANPYLSLLYVYLNNESSVKLTWNRDTDKI